MKRTLIPAAIAGLVVAGSWLPAAQAADKSLKSESDKVSYSMGLLFGQRMQGDLPELDMDKFIKGIKDGYNKDGKPLMSQDEVRQTLQQFQQKQRKEQMEKFQKQAEKNAKESKDFLEKNAKKDGVKKTDSGLEYKVIEEGTGPKPSANDKVTVDYTGTLINGKVFDSSRERGEPVTFKLSDVIPGWTEGLQLMKEGARYKFFIPPDLAYGPGGNRTIGPNQTLIFDVKLIKVNPKDESGSSDSKSDSGK